MADITIDYLVKHWFIKNYVASADSDKFYNDPVFIDKIKNKKTVSYSDDPNYLYTDCFPNYLYSDTTNIYIDNAPYGNFVDLANVANQLDVKNNPTTSFIRSNKITDLTYLKNMADLSDWKTKLATTLSDQDYKLVDSILLKEDAMQMIMLSRLESDIIFDTQIGRIDKKEEWKLPLDQADDSNRDLPEVLVFPDSDDGEHELAIEFSWNRETTGTVCPIHGSSYRYRRVTVRAQKAGLYKIMTYYNSSNTFYYMGSDWYVSSRYVDVYPDANDMGTYIRPGTTGDGYSTTEYVYLDADQEMVIHASWYYSYADDYDYPARVVVSDAFRYEPQALNLTEAELLFKDNNGEITEYDYLGQTYDTSSIIPKILVQILNIQSHLVMFNTKDSVLSEHEKYAINRFGFLKFKFVDSTYANIIYTIYKSLEIKDE